MTIADELFTVASELAKHAGLLNEIDFYEPLNAIEKAVEKVDKASSGSWLGYHSCVYYKNFSTPPPRARFSQEWGFNGTFQGTTGEWKEYAFDDVIKKVSELASNPDITKQKHEAQKARAFVEEAKFTIISCLHNASSKRPKDKFITEVLKDVEKERILYQSDIIETWRPSGKFYTRDMAAAEKGLQIPPHLQVLAEVCFIRQPFLASENLTKLARRAARHLTRQTKRIEKEQKMNGKIFIGHGRSNIWKDLKDFIQDRLHLPWDEFNRISIAGVTNIDRLSQMLDESVFAFLILTGEDEQKDGQLHARMNVIHEAGLFQGRLGFKKAIVLLEESCEEFSNIQGLGQIRFPKDCIKSAFEDIRQVLEREGIVELGINPTNNDPSASQT